MKLLIVIPALNEEKSIARVIEATLRAREQLLEMPDLHAVDITVVSDGSTDGTLSIARRYSDRIHLIAFEKSRGYGAAILEAWRKSDADLLAFLDADGTCEPESFPLLYQRLRETGADMVLGNRMHRKSHMPWLRRLGNRFFALLLRGLASRPIRDTSSGMRIVRRTALEKVAPLPSGLHFTPAMTARALLRKGLKIVEVDIPYGSRTGRSKLRLRDDSFKFLFAILDAAFLFRPARLFTFAASIMLALAGFLMIDPATYYIKTRTLQEWMIYRFLVSHFLGTNGILLLCAGIISDRMVLLTMQKNHTGRTAAGFLMSFLRMRRFWFIQAVILLLATVLIYPGIQQYLSSGHIDQHWSRIVVASFLFSLSLILMVTRLVLHVLNLIEMQLKHDDSPFDGALKPSRNGGSVLQSEEGPKVGPPETDAG